MPFGVLESINSAFVIEQRKFSLRLLDSRSYLLSNLSFTHF